MIACPTCGRVEVDLFTLANQVDEFLATIEEPIRVAVMGCVVNGPGEARDADVGLAAGNGKGVIFRKGKIVRTVAEAEMLDALQDEIRMVIDERRNGLVEDDPRSISAVPAVPSPDSRLAPCRRFIGRVRRKPIALHARTVLARRLPLLLAL